MDESILKYYRVIYKDKYCIVMDIIKDKYHIKIMSQDLVYSENGKTFIVNKEEIKVSHPYAAE